MEASNKTWTELGTKIAADESACLSDLLARENFFQSSKLNWLTRAQVTKFLDAMDADEARKLMRFSSGWHYASNPSTTRDFPVLQELLKCPGGSQLILRLAELEPDWVIRWLNWAISSSAFVAVPDLTEKIVPLVGRLSCLRGAPNSVAIVDWLVDRREESEALDLFNQLTNEWTGLPESDPVTQATKVGHKRLEAILHYPWQVCRLSDTKFSPWRDGIGHQVGQAVAAAVRSVPATFMLELGFSCGFRLAEQGVEPSVTTVDEQLTKLGIPSTDKLVEVGRQQ